MASKLEMQRWRRKLRVRTKVIGTSERPRLSVSISNRHITAQIIDDFKSITLAALTTSSNAMRKELSYTKNMKSAQKLGELLGKRAHEIGVKKVVFDRGEHIYHGRVRVLAEALRAQGVEF
jgi:large subunit ribosomal protein L18